VIRDAVLVETCLYRESLVTAFVRTAEAGERFEGIALRGANASSRAVRTASRHSSRAKVRLPNSSGTECRTVRSQSIWLIEMPTVKNHERDIVEKLQVADLAEDAARVPRRVLALVDAWWR
jgi:hypothetical protein